MKNTDKLKTKYEILQKRGTRRLLPFQKIVSLEAAKEHISKNMLDKIIDIDSSFTPIFSDNITYDDFLKKAKKFFGNITFKDTKLEGGSKVVNVAFDYCIVSIKYANKVEYSINVYWDN